jgi:hypothetical protein
MEHVNRSIGRPIDFGLIEGLRITRTEVRNAPRNPRFEKNIRRDGVRLLEIVWKANFVALLLACGLSENVFAGRKFSASHAELSQSLHRYLIEQRHCRSDRDCYEMLQMLADEGDRIHWNMYGQKNPKLAAAVGAYLLEHGIRVSRGKPIILRVFGSPKAEHMGVLGSIDRNDLIATVEVNK